MPTEKVTCATHCLRWSKKTKRCPKGAVSGKQEVGECNQFASKRPE